MLKRAGKVANARKSRQANNEAMNLQETLDKELEMHKYDGALANRKGGYVEEKMKKVEFRFDREWSCAQLKGKYEAIGRDLTDYSFLLDLPISSFSQKSLGDLQEARDKVKHEITEVETLTSVDVWKSELKKLREVTEISRRTRSPGSTSGEKERKR
ncbi:hypothetical protein Bca101_000454 [Brassica carinata]